MLGTAVSLFQGNNNITGSDADLGLTANDTISKQEFIKLMDDRICVPIRTCLEKKDPHMFMTKCYSKIEPEINGQKAYLFKGRIYRKYPTEGAIVFTECGKRQHLVDYKLFVDQDSLVVRESFRRGWQSSTSYVEEFCQDILKEMKTEQQESPKPKEKKKKTSSGY